MQSKEKYQAKGISLKFVGWLLSFLAVVVSALLVVSLQLISHEDEVVNQTYQNYLVLKETSTDVQLASDYLTEQVRLFVVNGKKEYMDNYFKEANVIKRRDKAEDKIHALTENTPEHDEIHHSIESAFNESMDLMNLEYYAMKLVCLDKGISSSDYDYDHKVENYTDGIAAITPENYSQEARNAVFGDKYMQSKATIAKDVNAALETIDGLMHDNVDKAAADLKRLFVFQTVIVVIHIVFVGAAIIFMHIFVLRPMNAAVKSLINNEEVHIHSNREFNYLASTYNRVHAQNERVKERLVYEAEHDKLTGLYNRTGYDALYRRMKLNRTIYVLLDIDKFKEVNDSLGHEMGDKVLIRTANALEKTFKEDNAYVFRIGGDEFAVLIEDASLDMDLLVVQKCKKLDAELSRPQGRIPGTTLSVGVAHGTIDDTTDTLFKKADTALYKVKQAGRANVSLYSNK